jgi:hypothetical protein
MLNFHVSHIFHKTSFPYRHHSGLFHVVHEREIIKHQETDDKPNQKDAHVKEPYPGGSPAILQQKPHNISLLTRIGRIPESIYLLDDSVEILHQNTLLVDEREKTRLALVATHAAESDPAKGQTLYHQMHQGVVDCDTSARCVLDYVILHGRVLREDIKSQRFFSSIYKFHRLLETSDGHYGQNGSKYFLLHYRIIRGDSSRDSGFDIILEGVGAPPYHYIQTIHQALEPLEVLVVHYGTTSRVVAVKLRQSVSRMHYELLLDGFCAQDVIRCDASLSRVQTLAPHHSRRCQLQVSTGVNIDRILTSHF